MTCINDLIEARLEENKSGIRTYASFKMAKSKAEKLAANFDSVYGVEGKNRPMEFTIAFVESVGKFTPIFNMSKWMHSSHTGCYLAYFAAQNFMSV